MHKNHWWQALLISVGLISIYFFGKTGVDLYRYLSLNHSAEAKIESLCVKELKKNHYAAIATFSFTKGEKSILSEGVLGPIYPNQYAADLALPELAKTHPIAWYRTKHPEKAVLEKRFPFKSTLSAVVLLGIVGYFLVLGFYVGKKL